MDGWGKERAAEVKAAFLDFLNNVAVKSKEAGWVILGENLYDAQIRVIDAIFDGLGRDIHSFKILKSRQLGISTVTRALMLFWSGVFPLTGALVFHTTDALNDARQELIDMLERMDPKFRFPRKAFSNRFSLGLDNKSRINLMSAGTRETKGGNALGAGSAISLAHRSELCSYGNKAGLEAMRHSMARSNPNRLFVDESTARGRNLWYEIWEDGKRDPECVCIFVGWWSHPLQVIKRGTAAFDKYTKFPLTDEEKRKIKLVKEKYNHTITIEQLAWIRREMDIDALEDDPDKKDFSGDPMRIQEQPWCVTGETRVGTDFGMIRIDEAIAGMTGTHGYVQRADLTSRSAPIWRARTRLGYEVRGTADHPLIDVSGNEIPLKDSLGKVLRLSPPRFSDRICVPEWRDGPLFTKIEITPDFARLVGLYMGDGSLQGAGKNGGAGYFCISCDAQDQDVIDECVRLIKSVFCIDAPARRQGQTNCVDVRVGSRLIVETFRRLGLARNDTGPTMRKIHVPDFIFRSPRHVVKEFLSGLFEADGYNGSAAHRVALFSKYPAFIKDVQRLLLAFGITSRATMAFKKKSGQYTYIGNQLELRAAEARKFNEEIGFLSARKRNKHTNLENSGKTERAKRAQIVLEDEVTQVFYEGVSEPVYNLTIEGTHWYDANGILTHNCEEESWQLTGATFFDPAKINDQANKWAHNKYTGYMFMPGFDFVDMQVTKAPTPRDVQLKVWEEPVEDSIYVVGVDPAYGINEKNDRSCIQVLRAYSDGLDQVAEYAWPLIDSQKLAWVICALEAWYSGEKSEVYRILELNGPGDATFRELLSMKQKLANNYFGTQLADRGLVNIQRNVRDYFYHRTDSMNPSLSYHFKTNQQLKIAILERLRDFTNSGLIRIRSHDTLQEMADVTRDGDDIGADGSDHDDRVLAMALACRCWEERVRRRMMQSRRTREAEVSRRRMTTVDMVKAFNESQFSSFLAGRDARRRAFIMAQQGRHWGGRR